jgi:Lrp/AsnC family transcriptional regulator for asnA, asnC and gidA
VSPAPRPEIDDVDRALIAGLVEDGRATYAALAPRVALSQAAVRTRVQRLFEEQIITVTGRVDPSSLGLGVFTFAFLEVRGQVDKLAAAVAEIDAAVFIVITTGRFDLMVELRCTDDDHLLDSLDRLRELEGVRRLQTATALHYDKQDWTGVGRRDAVPAVQPSAAGTRDLDAVDRRLLVELMSDGRATYATLAPLVNLSQAAVRDRVLDLLAHGVVSIQAHPVPEAMGIGGFAALAIKATGPVEPLVASLVDLPETCLVASTLGRFDVTAEVWFDDHDHLADIVDRVRAASGTGSVDTIPYLRIAHEAFEAGLSR